MPLSPGTPLGPYEILSPLGAGGMGEVYRARDTRLGREVAVKVLPVDVAGSSSALARFESEARAVAALSHPNILALHDVGEANGIHYAVTELLEGRSLRAALEEGPLSLRRVLDVAVEIAEALTAAHEKGIVHRDVKPENVFLLKSGHVKLLDFGLARHGTRPERVAETETPTVEKLTSQGAVVGTVAYMSPEQAKGQPIDFRSDQFSLGVVVYEMLAGRRPFRGNSTAETLAAIIRDEAEPLSSLAPSVPESLQWTVERCLAKDTVDRYASTEDLARQLADCRSHVTRGSGDADSDGAARLAASGANSVHPTPATAVVSSTPTRKVRFLVGAAAAVVIAAAAVLFLRNRAAPSASPPANSSSLDPKRVAVAPFENRTGDASLEPVGKMAAEWIAEGLSGIRIDVVPSSDVFDVPASDGDANKGRESSRKLAERTGAGIVVSGAFYLDGTDVRLQAQVSDVISGRLLHALSPASAPRGNPMQGIDAVRRQVKDLLGVHLGVRGEGLLRSETAPPRYEAYLEFLLGQEAGAGPAAEAHYRKAVELDPGFVAPRSFLVAVLTGQLRFAEADRELTLLEERRSSLSPVEQHYVAMQRGMLAGRNDDVLAAARSAAELFPRSADGLFELSTAAWRANRPAEAVEALNRPVRWDLFLAPPRGYAPVYFGLLGQGYHALGRHEEELAAVRRGRARYPSAGRLVIAEARALVAFDRLEEADRLIAESLTRTEFAKQASRLLLEAALELRAHGHPVEARKMAERCVAQVRGRPAGSVASADRQSLAHCLYEAGMWAEAASAYEALEKELPRTDPTFRGLRAVAAWRAGDVATSTKIEDELRRLDRPYLRGEHLFLLALLAAQRGEKDRAVLLLREALVQGFANGVEGISFTAHRFSQFEPLRGYPPFEELVKPKG